MITASWRHLCAVALVVITTVAADGILFPQNSETRETQSLDGLWRFVVGSNTSKYERPEHATPRWMPVPASYNDIVTEMEIRDHFGVVWYDREFFVPRSWQDQEVWLRFGSVNYHAVVFVNDHFAVEHHIGHLPFRANITALLNFGAANNITVLCDNSLTPTTIPQGNETTVETDEGKKVIQTYTFDFLNYAGIHRPVYLYTTPKSYIDDITVRSEIFNETLATVHFKIEAHAAPEADCVVGVKLYDARGDFVTSVNAAEGALKVHAPILWWPYLMNPTNTTPGYLYTMQVELYESGELIDVYRQKIGIRSIRLTDTSLLLNDVRVYMTGFGRHEDADIRGRGFDLATVIKDHNLIQWVGGNAYRTSHYPYAEEIMHVADALGIMIIDECPAVNIDFVNDELLANHMQSISELIQRDKNHASVVAWSVANEPRSQKANTVDYWRVVVDHTRGLDATRPITASLNREYHEDKLAPFLDFVSFNRYNSWYRNEGRLDMIIKQVINEAKAWRDTFKKPVLMSEYGADTMEGLHLSPAYIWSEEYQVAVMSKHFQAFDQLRAEGWFLGEFIWNFADFKTSEKTTRVGGNKKGIFTRARQPKAAAHLLRKRYFHLAHDLYGAPLPADLREYVIGGGAPHLHADEL